jgi:aldehyde dehydrogenase (NAD+)
MGYRVAEKVGRRLGRTILELGGNNGVIVMDDANLDLALRAVLFGAIGTAGQRCTTIRRLFLQKGIARRTRESLVAAYRQLRIGHPLEETTLMGPLVNRGAVEEMRQGLDRIREQGGEILYGGERLELPGGCYVQPALVEARPEMPVLKEELFAPVLYLIEFESLEQALTWHNDVPQGLSSAIFTTNLVAAETFLSARGGGREAGSDAWKAYMRRQTVTVNWSDELPLAQGIAFDL